MAPWTAASDLLSLDPIVVLALVADAKACPEQDVYVDVIVHPEEFELRRRRRSIGFGGPHIRNHADVILVNLSVTVVVALIAGLHARGTGDGVTDQRPLGAHHPSTPRTLTDSKDTILPRADGLFVHLVVAVVILSVAALGRPLDGVDIADQLSPSAGQATQPDTKATPDVHRALLPDLLDLFVHSTITVVIAPVADLGRWWIGGLTHQIALQTGGQSGALTPPYLDGAFATDIYGRLVATAVAIVVHPVTDLSPHPFVFDDALKIAPLAGIGPEPLTGPDLATTRATALGKILVGAAVTVIVATVTHF